MANNNDVSDCVGVDKLCFAPKVDAAFCRMIGSGILPHNTRLRYVWTGFQLSLE